MRTATDKGLDDLLQKTSKINFHVAYSRQEQQHLLETNCAGVSLKEMHNIFLGTYDSHTRHTNDRELNARGLTLLWLRGWNFANLLQYLGRLNDSDRTINEGVFTQQVD